MRCRKGEELVQSYRERSNRNDIALLHHFFLNERRPALMCKHDLPNAAAHPTTQQPWTDAHYMPGGPLSTKVGESCRGTGVLLMCASSTWPHDDFLAHACPVTLAVQAILLHACVKGSPQACQLPTRLQSLAIVLQRPFTEAAAWMARDLP